MKDRLVIDLETKNTFNDVGGKDKLRDLAVSLVGVYSYNQDKFIGFREDRLPELGPMLQNAGLIIGFNIKHFDLPVLNKYYNFNLEALPQIDLLKEVDFEIEFRGFRLLQELKNLLSDFQRDHRFFDHPVA